jgi:hypothetical protein
VSININKVINKVMSAMRRLTKWFLTPTPTLTGVKHLFSIASLIADDNRIAFPYLGERYFLATFNFDLS